jgi:hypothetical protein
LQNEKEYEFLLTASINGFFVSLSPAELKISNEITCSARTSTSVSVSRGFGGAVFQFRFRLFTRLFTLTCKRRIFFVFFDLSTVVDKFVRNLLEFSLLKSGS